VGGIYTCVDAKGRKITADRPIPECTDREQKLLNPSGTVKTKVGPTLTAQERADQEAKEKRDAEERNRTADEKRRDRALLIRYPNKAVHDQERQEALIQIGVVIQAAQRRVDELGKQRVAIDEEMEFYKKDPSKAPAYVRRQLEENTNSQQVQRRFISEQEAEIKRVNARFDEELVRLRQLWAMAAPAAAASR
jgi:serine phosphatase RsbU (regulator of sigma subunit)